jgi:argininosuccinate synthase
MTSPMSMPLKGVLNMITKSTNLIRSFHDLKDIRSDDVIVCLDSGGLDSAYLITRLIQAHSIKLHVLTLDIGQEDNLPIILPTAIEQHLIRHRINAKKEFVNDFVFPLLYAHGIYAKQHPLSASLSRPLIAKHLVEIGKKVHANILLHAATPSQNSMRRFNTAISDLSFNGRWGSPYLHDIVSREEKARYLLQFGATVSEQRLFSVDSNLFCREFESGTLLSAETIIVPEEMFLWTRKKSVCATEIKLRFEAGHPVSVNNQPLKGEKLFENLNQLIGQFQLGRYQGLEESPSGEKVVEVREAPAAFILLFAFNELLNATYNYDTIIAKGQLEQLWTKEACEGRWYGNLKKSIDAFNSVLMQQLSGEVSFALDQRQCSCTGVTVPNPRYSKNRETLEIVDQSFSNRIAA